MLNTQALRSQYRKERRLLCLNPPLEAKDQLSDREMGIYHGTKNWALFAAIILIAGCWCPKVASTETLKQIVKRQIQGSGATVHEITVRKFSASEMAKIKEARKQLAGSES